MAYRLKLTEKLDRGFHRVGLAQIDAAITRLRTEEDAPHAVHMTRKALKKVRALLRLVKPGLEADQFRAENTRYRDIGRDLSAMRDRHVMGETVAMLPADSEPPLKTAYTQLLRRTTPKGHATDAKHDTPSRTTAAGREALSDAADRLVAAREAFSGLVVTGGMATAFTGITDSYRKARRAMHHGFVTLDAEDLHEFRKHTQHHWRHMQLISVAWPEHFEARGLTARRLSTILGQDHDLDMVVHHLTEAGGPRMAALQRERVLQDIADRQAVLRATAHRLGQQLFTERPGPFGETVAFHWATAAESRSEAEPAAAE